jgi:hypothetical protein
VQNTELTAWLNSVRLMCETNVDEYEIWQKCTDDYSALTSLRCRNECGSTAMKQTAVANLAVGYNDSSIQFLLKPHQTATRTENHAATTNSIAALCAYLRCTLHCQWDVIDALCDTTASSFQRRYTRLIYTQLVDEFTSSNQLVPDECRQLANVQLPVYAYFVCEAG